MSEGESNKVVGFTIRLNDGVSANARAVEAAIKKTAQETQKAIKAVEEYNAACAAKSTATDNVAMAEEAYRAALKESGAASREAQAAARGTAKAYEELQKATDKVSAAEAKKAMALENAQAAQANLNDLISKTGTISAKSAREVTRIGRALQSLASGDIPGAIRALGSLGTKLGVTAAAVGVFWASFKAGRATWDWFERTFGDKNDITKGLRDGLSRITSEISQQKKALDGLVSAYQGAIEKIDAQSKRREEQNRYERDLKAAMDEETFWKGTGASTSADRQTERRDALRKRQLEAQSASIASDYAAETKSIEAKRRETEDFLRKAEARIASINLTVDKARNEQISAVNAASRDDDYDKTVQEANAKLKAAQQEQARWNAEIAKAKEALKSLSDEQEQADRKRDVAMAKNRAATAQFDAEQRRAAAERKKAAEEQAAAALKEKQAIDARIAALEREGALRQKNREIAVKAAADLASLPILGKDANAQDRLAAAKAEVEKNAKWQLEPLKAAAEAAKTERIEAEKTKDAEKIAAAKMKERDANAELLKQEALLKIEGIRRLQELSAQEKENADQRAKDAQDALSEEKKRHRHVMADIDAEVQRQEQAKQDAKSRAKFDAKKNKALQQLAQGAGVGIDAIAEDMFIDDDGQIQFKHKRAEDAFNRLSKKDKAAAALGLKEQKAAKEVKEAVEKAQKDQKAAGDEQKKANQAALVKIPTVLSNMIGALKNLSQIDMGEAEGPVNDPTGSLHT